MKTKAVTAITICLVILCTLFFGGCKSKSSATTSASSADEASSLSSYDVITPATAQNESTPSTEAPSAAPAGTDAAATDAAKETTPNSTQAKPQTNGNADNDSSNGAPVDSDKTETMTCTVTVGDKDYTANLGDIITYTYYIKTPKSVEDVQAKVSYTPDCLLLIEDKQETMLPVISDGAILNTQSQGVVIYNAINISGFDFTKEAVLITLRFKVVYGGSGSINNAIEFMTEKGGEVAYVDNYKFAKDVKYREALN